MILIALFAVRSFVFLFRLDVPYATVQNLKCDAKSP